MWALVLIVILTFTTNILTEDDDVFKERNLLIEREINMMLGNDIVLSDSELEVNKIIMQLKQQELDNGFYRPDLFNLSKHFFDYKDEVKKTKMFEILQKMPKGAVLHAHDTGILLPDYVLHLTYLPHLYVCFTEDAPHYRFSINVPDLPCDSQWQLLETARQSSGNVGNFDAKLSKFFSLVIPNPNEIYTDVDAVWDKFNQYFMSTNDLFAYKPVWEMYFYDTLKAFREENIMYIEIRSVLPELYDLEGNIYDSVATAESYKAVLDRFMKDYPDFYGAKLIYAPIRSVDPKVIEDYMLVAKEIKKRLPDFFAGFDLVGQEDKGMPLLSFYKTLKESSDEFDYFFHAGETNWYGMSTDENLFDAIVLGARRIGHAYAIIKHPILVEEVKKRRIAIECNVVSNAVLKLVEDVRNHPLAAFLALDLPVVISSDDPGLWGADPITHDFYVTFMGVSSQHADLKLLKKLALNSLTYSSHSDKIRLIEEFEKRWYKFINSLIHSENVCHDNCMSSN